MSATFEAVIFDFDGTLYDNYKIGKNLISSHPLQLFRIKADRDTRKILKGQNFENGKEFFENYYNIISKKTDMSVKKAEKWYQNKYMPWMVAVLNKKYNCHPGAYELLKKLNDKGIKTAVFSDYDFVKERMEAVGINPSVCTNLYSAVELGGLKPAENPFMTIAKELGVEPSKILVIGDRDDTDGQGARNCGMQFIQIKITATKTKAEDVKHPLLSWNELCDFLTKEASL